MKKTIALALLLFASPNAFSARVLWMDVDRDAIVQYADGRQENVSDLFNARTDKVLAVRATVSNENAPGSTSYLVFCYEDDSGRLVADDQTSRCFQLTGDGGGEAVATWIPVAVGDDVDASKYIVMELGYYDPDGWDDNDPSTWTAAFETFETVAYAGATLGYLANPASPGGAHLSNQSDLSHPSGVDPWSPKEFISTAVPEPATCALGLLGAALLLRRRKRTAA